MIVTRRHAPVSAAHAAHVAVREGAGLRGRAASGAWRRRSIAGASWLAIASWALTPLGHAAPLPAAPAPVSAPVAAAEPVLADAPDGAPLTDLRWTGLLRLRGQWLRDGSLGNGVGGLPSSVGAATGNAASEQDRLAQGDLRLRLAPQLALGSYATIDAQLDVAGRAVLGSDPREDGIATRLLSMEGHGPLRDGLALRRLWATFDVFGIARLEVGRTPDHFGMGLRRNDGRDVRADWQSDVDRVRLSVAMFGLKIAVSRDTMASLPMFAKGLAADDLRYPLADSTDVIRWQLQVEADRAADAAGLRWAFAVGYQDQTSALQLEHDPAAAQALAAGCLARGTCVQLEDRGAALLTPQVFVAWHRPLTGGGLWWQAEAAGIVGAIDNSDSLAATDTSKVVASGGAATRLQWRRWLHLGQLDAGIAWGDDEGGFGVLDRANLKISGPSGEVHRSVLTGMPMHRGFLVDGLLFREVIGAVANAAYLRPAWRWTAWGTPAPLAWLDGAPPAGDPSRGVDIEIAALGAMATRRGSTPGRALWLGVEPELRVDWRLGALGTAMLQGSLLVPGAALAAGPGGEPAAWATRLSLDWVTRF